MQDFHTYVIELLQPWREVSAKRMFGGHGLYHEGLMFGLILGGQLYLKVDDESRPHFLAQNLKPFEYEARTRRVSLSYYQAPSSLLDEPDQAAHWAELAWQAALRSSLSKKPKTSKKTSGPTLSKRGKPTEK